MSAEEIREVTTLLLCTVTPRDQADYRDQYKRLHPCHRRDARGQQARFYFTFGGFDALAVYPTPPAPGAEPEQWLAGILRDKREIVMASNPDVSYHPIHLVRYRSPDRRDREIPENAVLLVTFLYGLNPEKEEAINRRVQALERGGARVSFYRCINISDRVMLTYTQNVEEALEAIYGLELDGEARKTYTTINFPLDTDSGTVRESVLRQLEDSEFTRLTLRIQGTLRRPADWDALWDRLKQNLGGGDVCRYFHNFGEADFVISVRVTGLLLRRILEFFATHSREISGACWDIHTELQFFDAHKSRGLAPGDKPSPAAPQRGDCGASVLEAEERRLADSLSRWFSASPAESAWTSWLLPLKELVSAQKNIDLHPLLRGPAFLLWDSIHIVNDYLADAAAEAEGGDFRRIVTDVVEAPKLLTESKVGIERFSRCLSQLTDQLTRNDDIVFRGIGRLPTITTTLPENLLEFYHAILRKLTDCLIAVDFSRDYVKPDPATGDRGCEYGFLIAPELNQRVRISQVFQTQARFRSPEREGSAFRSWPSKQVHIIQLPIDQIFDPIQCIIPLAHECFHFFGDHLRQRGFRSVYIQMFLSRVISSFLEDGLQSAQDREQLQYIIWRILGSGIQTEKTTDYDLYWSRLKHKLTDNYLRAMQENGLKAIYAKLKQSSASSSTSYLLYYDTVRSWRNREDSFFSAVSDTENVSTGSRVIDLCEYFFRECYADIITTSTPDIRIDEYLSSYLDELSGRFDDDATVRQERYESKLMIVYQRIAIVLAAYCEKARFKKDVTPAQRVEYRARVERCTDGIRAFEQKLFDGRQAPGGCGEVLGDCFLNLLTDESKAVQPLQPKSAEQPNRRGYEAVFPPAALRCVVDYLLVVQTAFEATKTETKQYEQISVKDRIAALPKLVDTYFRREEMFRPSGSGPEGFDKILEENRTRIQRRACGSTAAPS